MFVGPYTTRGVYAPEKAMRPHQCGQTPGIASDTSAMAGRRPGPAHARPGPGTKAPRNSRLQVYKGSCEGLVV